MMSKKTRCEWVKLNNPLYIQYHDEEWGRPCFDEQKLFEMLCLEGQQAGLSWETVLNKRQTYREVFFQFDPERVARISDEEVMQFLQNSGLIRNKLKLFSIRNNARAYLALREQDLTLKDFLWRYVDHTPIVNHWGSLKDLPAQTEISNQMSKDLKKLHFKFVGSTICYALMQAVGMVSDHTSRCYLSQ